MSVTAAAPLPPCERCSSPLEDGDLRCAVCALPAPHAERGAVDAAAKILRCTRCNAAIGFDPKHRAPACAFCGAVMAIEQPVDPVETARLWVPFTVERDQASAALRGWLGKRGFFAPRALHDHAVLESMTPIYWAAWTVRADALVAWTADSDHGSGRSDWAPHAGETPLVFDRIVVSASRGLAEGECHELVPFYDLSVARPLEGSDVACETFEVQRSTARMYVHHAIQQMAKTRVEDVIPGRRFRNIHVACLIERQTTERIALPAWILAYRYRDRPYRAIVHGQRADIVIGRSPLDWTKIIALAALAAAIAAVIIVLALAK